MAKKYKITMWDYILANRIGSREAELENKTGFVSKHKAHRSKKNYNRKDKSWKKQ